MVSSKSAKVQQEQLQGVDIFKYIMALAVVAIHVSIGSCCGIQFSPAIRWFNSLAVPFFFITSGYLLARKINGYDNPHIKGDIIRERAVKVFRLFGLWVLIYLPLSVIVLTFDHLPFYKIITQTVAAIICRGEMACAYPLWYLYSLALTTLAISIAVKHTKFSFVYLIIVVLSYIGYIATLRYDITTLPRAATLIINSLPLRALGGGIYILSGMMIYKIRQRALYSLIYPAVLIALSLTMSLADIPISELIGGIALFLIANHIGVKNKAGLCQQLRIQSMWIYYMHMYVIFFVVLTAHIRQWRLELWPTYIIVATITAIIAAILSYLQRIPRFTFLKILIK